MPNWSGSILTTKGQALQAKVDAGQTMLTLTKMKIGSGVIPGGQNLQNLNDLVAPELIVPISGVSASGNMTTVTGVITNAGIENGFNVRELGLFAQDPTLGEILYSITTDSAPDYLPPEGGAVTVSEEFSINIVVSNTANVTAMINPSGLITASILAAHENNPDAHGNRYLKLEGGTLTGAVNGVTPVQFDSTQKLATTEFVQKSLGNASGYSSKSTSAILTAAEAGNLITFNTSSAATCTLPATATVSIGASFWIVNAGQYNVTLQPSASENLYVIGNGSPLTIILRPGDSALVTRKSGIDWYCYAGSAYMVAASSIVSSGTNWIKFADGTMIQKASATLVSNVTVQTYYRYAVGVFTFPLAFVNTAYSTQFIHGGHIPIMFTEYNSDGSKTASQVKCTAVGVEINTSGVGTFRTDLPWTVVCTAVGRWKA